MGKMKQFQICYEGELSIELVEALRKVEAQPNFENSWELEVPSRRHSVILLRYLRRFLPPDGRLLVGRLHHARNRDFLLVRHSASSASDYSRLQVALGAFGAPLDIGFDATHVIRADTEQDVRMIGEALSEFCPGESLMVTGLNYDFATWRLGAGRMMMPSDSTSVTAFRSF